MASKRRLRRKACSGKIAYKTLADAMGARNSMIKRFGLRKVISAYKCEYCGMYHIGHTPYNVRQSIRDKQKNEL